MNNAQAVLNGKERDLNSNNSALEKADKSFDEAGYVAKDFSNSVKKAADTGKDAYGKLSKLIDTVKNIGAALGAAAALLKLCHRLQCLTFSALSKQKSTAIAVLKWLPLLDLNQRHRD